MIAGSWVSIVGKGYIRSDKDIVFQRDSVPDLNPAFNGNTIADNSTPFYEAMRANVTVGSNSGLWQNDTKLPDTGS